MLSDRDRDRINSAVQQTAEQITRAYELLLEKFYENPEALEEALAHLTEMLKEREFLPLWKAAPLLLNEALAEPLTFEKLRGQGDESA